MREILLSDNQQQITIGIGFRDCFSNRTNLINNDTLNSRCNNFNCHLRQWIHDFDRENVYVIDECQQGNNCSKEQSICQDPLDLCEYHHASLENSNSIYDGGGTEEV